MRDIAGIPPSTLGEMRSHAIVLLTGVIIAFLAFFLFSRPVHAFDCVYQQTTGGAIGDFSAAANWTGCNSAVPGAGDSVFIPNATTTNLSANITVSAITATGTINVVSFVLTATSSVEIASTGTVTSTSGTLNFNTVTGSTSSSGSIGTINGNLSIGGVFTNGGTLNVGAGSATTTGNVTNTGTINNDSGTLSVSGNFTDTGTYNAGTGTFRLSGAGTQSITGQAFNNLSSIKTAGVATFVTNNSTVGGTFVSYNAGTLSSGSVTFTVTGATTVGGTASVTSTSGTLTFSGTVTSTGSIGSSSGNILFSSTLQNNGTLDIGSGVTTSTGHATSTGTINNGGGRYELAADFGNTGTYNGQTGTLKLTGTAGQLFSGTSSNTNLYNLTVNKSSGTVTFTGNVTSTGTFTNTAGTVAVGNNRFAATGTYTNGATITVGASGSIIHPVDDLNFTNASFVNVSTYAAPGAIYINLTDPNRNLLGGTVETFNVTIAGDASAGSDSETLTLTETSAASGIFQNATALNLFDSGVAVQGNNQLDITAAGSITINYTDTLDASDTASDSVTVTMPTAAAATGGGPGGSGNVPLPPGSDAAEIAGRLLYFDDIGQNPHNLVKLPDDGNPNTQSDSAVYYLGLDGKRHAFPNSNAYFTWYPNFQDVKTIPAGDLAGIPLGKNITYKPGVKMVKFTTDNRVYAVSIGGVLRWIQTEQLATQLYGSSWNTLIDDVNDAFYANYGFGPDIADIADFDPIEMRNQVTYPSDNM